MFFELVHFEPAGQLQTVLIKSTEMSSSFRTLKFVENGQQSAGLLLATQGEKLTNLFLEAKESVCTRYEGKQIWLVWLLTELSFEVNFTGWLTVEVVEEKVMLSGGMRNCPRTNYCYGYQNYNYLVPKY